LPKEFDSTAAKCGISPEGIEMNSKTVSEYLLERTAKKLGCLPIEVPRSNSDIGFAFRVCVHSQKCKPVDWAGNGEPIYTETDLMRCIETVRDELNLSS
jgi:hypothetical protein